MPATATNPGFENCSSSEIEITKKSMPSDSSQYLEKMALAFTEDADAASRKLALQIDKVRTDKARVFLCGNGGSAANANHWANDLIYGAAKGGRGGVRAHSLSANTSVLMCLANDTGYENIFSGQLEVLASPGDILVALSGSGNSPNILRALEAGNRLGLETWAIVGFDGGKALEMARYAIHFPVHDMQMAEDLQMVVCHILTKQLARSLE
jgi:D-sedoheptulose 7-phosphate isomerase